MRGLLFIGLGSAAIAAACAATSGGTSSTEGGTDTTASNGGAGGVGGDGGGFGFTGGNDGGNVPVDECKVNETQGDAPPPCDEEDVAPPDSFVPEVQWTWTDPDGFGSLVSVIAANFDDDNGDGATDLCDVPDVVVTTFGTFMGPGSMYLLDGATGDQKFKFQGAVDGNIQPALADIDGDGLVEVVAASPDGNLIAFENTGELKWTGPRGGWTETLSSYCTAISIYDLDGDGSPEIIAAFEVFDADGTRRFGIPGNGTEFPSEAYWCPTSTAADLTGDGRLEVIFGHEAWDADGNQVWKVPNAKPGHPHVANFDADADAEIYHATADGMYLIEHDGTVTFGPVRPTGGAPSARCWGKPGAVHDFDGDGMAEIVTGTCTDYSMYEVGASATPMWSQPVSDSSGLATGSAFDFLGDGIADAIYADETQIYVFEGATGMSELTSPRQSGTLIEYPIVVDVDNDRSAEIIYVSNGGTSPTVTVLGEARSRWVASRRIWNQHAYHVTNIREDGIVPAVPKKSWLGQNTFRVNSQVNGEGDCAPPVPD